MHIIRRKTSQQQTKVCKDKLMKDMPIGYVEPSASITPSLTSSLKTEIYVLATTDDTHGHIICRVVFVRDAALDLMACMLSSSTP